MVLSLEPPRYTRGKPTGWARVKGNFQRRWVTRQKNGQERRALRWVKACKKNPDAQATHESC